MDRVVVVAVAVALTIQLPTLTHIMSSVVGEIGKKEIIPPPDDEENKTSSSTRYRRNIQLVELSLENISYAPINTAQKKKGKRKTILSNVSTTISPYELTAWMGPSGSGKTSLLSCCAGLIADPENDLSKDSCIRINGEQGALPKRLIGIVHQDDLLLSNLTVKETIRFAARLKSSKHNSEQEVDKLVDETISRLGLSHVQNSVIGSPGGNCSKISGGERKRVAVAVELVARPSVLLLDEASSGLDATTAYQLMVTLKELASLGHAIVVAIHQPRTSIFNLFDKLLLLSKGKVVYEGEPSEARQFLESCPDVNALPPETGKADWIMDVITDDEKRDEGGSLPLLWTNHFENKQNQPQCQAGDSQLKQRNSTGKRHSHSKKLQRRLSSLRELENEPKFEATFLTQLKLLIIRAQRQGRGERITRVALLLTICWTIFTGLAWGYLPNDTDYVFNRASLLYFILIAQSNSVVTTSMLTFGGERRLLSRERAKKMYGVLPYFIAKTLADMVNSVVMPMVYGIAVYWICNLRPTAAHFFTFVLIYYLSVSAAQSFGLFLSIAIPNFSVALMLAPLLTICLIILGGFYIPFDKMGPALAWASWISPARYGFTAFIVNEFYGRQIPCAPNTTTPEVCPLPGSSVLSSFGISGAWSNLWINVGMLLAIQVFLRVITYFLLLRSK